MKPLTAKDIYGTWATILLPIEDDDSIHFGKLSQQLDRLIEMKVHGIYSNGTAAEFFNQTEEEFERVNELLAEKCEQAGMAFQVGCNHTNPTIARNRVLKARSWKPGAIQIILPDWFPPTLPEMIAYLLKMQEAAGDIGLVLYNPPHAKVKLTAEHFNAFRQSGIHLVGCKLAGGDEAWYREMRVADPEISLFTPGNRLATGIKLGANGSYSNVACIHPGVARKWYDLMLTDYENSLKMQTRIQQFISQEIYPLIREKGYSDPAVDKLLACLTGWADLTPKLRWPYQYIPETELKRLQIVCREFLPEFF